MFTLCSFCLTFAVPTSLMRFWQYQHHVNWFFSTYDGIVTLKLVLMFTIRRRPWINGVVVYFGILSCRSCYLYCHTVCKNVYYEIMNGFSVSYGFRVLKASITFMTALHSLIWSFRKLRSCHLTALVHVHMFLNAFTKDRAPIQSLHQCVYTPVCLSVSWSSRIKYLQYWWSEIR